MIPEIEGGGGIPRNKRGSSLAKLLPASARRIYFAAEIHRPAGTVVGEASSRFLHSAVPFGFAQGPAPVGMTRMMKVSKAEARSPKAEARFTALPATPSHRRTFRRICNSPRPSG